MGGILKYLLVGLGVYLIFKAWRGFLSRAFGSNEAPNSDRKTESRTSQIRRKGTKPNLDKVGEYVDYEEVK
ncbi:MAG: hypothetical protein HRT74_10365 [Flavobacteriales bacterium]|nr:hypothetical protein [Flavobacteriales bacterium]